MDEISKGLSKELWDALRYDVRISLGDVRLAMEPEAPLLQRRVWVEHSDANRPPEDFFICYDDQDLVVRADGLENGIHRSLAVIAEACALIAATPKSELLSHREYGKNIERIALETTLPLDYVRKLSAEIRRLS